MTINFLERERVLWEGEELEKHIRGSSGILVLGLAEGGRHKPDLSKAVAYRLKFYSDDGLWRELKARKAEWVANEIQAIFRTGDCKAPVQLNQAMWDAHRLAREFGRHSELLDRILSGEAGGEDASA